MFYYHVAYYIFTNHLKGIPPHKCIFSTFCLLSVISLEGKVDIPFKPSVFIISVSTDHKMPSHKCSVVFF